MQHYTIYSLHISIKRCITQFTHLSRVLHCTHFFRGLPFQQMEEVVFLTYARHVMKCKLCDLFGGCTWKWPVWLRLGVKNKYLFHACVWGRGWGKHGDDEEFSHEVKQDHSVYDWALTWPMTVSCEEQCWWCKLVDTGSLAIGWSGRTGFALVVDRFV